MSTHRLADTTREATAEEICDIYGMTGQELANAINESVTLPVDCPHCDGAGWIEGAVYGVCRTTGAPLSDSYQCITCMGSGRVEEEIVPRTEDDMENEAAEERGDAWDDTHAIPCKDGGDHDWQLADHHRNIDECRKCGMRDA